MRDSHDTFLHLLADNLGAIPVHEVRKDKNNPSADSLQENAVNLCFESVVFDVHVGILAVTLDVIHDDQLTALTWAQAVWDILSAAFMTPKMTYTSGSPVAVVPNTNIYWKTNIKFRPIKSEYYYHYSCLLALHNNPKLPQ